MKVKWQSDMQTKVSQPLTPKSAAVIVHFSRTRLTKPPSPLDYAAAHVDPLASSRQCGASALFNSHRWWPCRGGSAQFVTPSKMKYWEDGDGRD